MTTSHTKAPRFHFNRAVLPSLAAVGLLLIMLIGGEIVYGRMIAPNTLSNLLINNEYLIILAVALTFTILTGGIDLSVGAVVAFSSVAGVTLLNAGVPVPVAVILMIGAGSGFGLISGSLVRFFNVQPFIATLATMFLARGLASILSTEPVRVPEDSSLRSLSNRIILYDGPKTNDVSTTINVLIALAVVAGAVILLHRTRFGRTVYAIGGSEQSGRLMGLPTDRTKLLVYVISGSLAGLAAVVYTARLGTAQNVTGVGWELDAIAAAVIGGTLLTGGAGYVLGSLAGALVLGTLNVLITRDGGVSAAATTVITGAILLLFVLFQRVVTGEGLPRFRRRDGGQGPENSDGGGTSDPLPATAP